MLGLGGRWPGLGAALGELGRDLKQGWEAGVPLLVAGVVEASGFGIGLVCFGFIGRELGGLPGAVVGMAFGAVVGALWQARKDDAG